MTLPKDASFRRQRTSFLHQESTFKKKYFLSFSALTLLHILFHSNTETLVKMKQFSPITCYSKRHVWNTCSDTWNLL